MPAIFSKPFTDSLWILVIFNWGTMDSQARIAGALGGRAAEQLVFGTNQVTTGRRKTGEKCGSQVAKVLLRHTICDDRNS